ncbi:MAG: ABC transporter ATP-binding protein [Thaumarchaeota archaeon]|jgi:putative ABC transport system ATP-binding protein|nr:ABC transporter ATP-binding protein [Candidatus Geocrenenecus arthurdayi]MCL7396977.1 ABC transporter ATP-binding protein [Candidatus Geocrenenecus arthurdayi]MCL7403680.1 ABC transporter ATP-binding protein [Candidatus Geocrenenecus arthurdayi]
MSSDKPVIELINLKKIYYSDGIATPALRGITLKIMDGEFVAIVGPSGSGKSTLLNMIGALDRPTEGRVLIDGIDINKLSDDGLAELRNKKIGFIFQTYNLLARISVLRNVELPLIVRGTPAQVRRKKALSALEEVGLRDKALNKPTQLSGGEQQRVAIARALVSDPKILLADEPTGNLDSANAKLIAELFSKLNQKGRTIVMVTHNMAIASYAKRIIYLRDGMIEREVVNA